MKYNEAVKSLRILEINFRANSMTPEWHVKAHTNESDYTIYSRQINLIHEIHASNTATHEQQLEWRELVRLRSQIVADV